MISVLAWAALLLSSPIAAATTYYVDDSAPAGGSGLAWSTSFDDLQDALAVAVSGNEILVGQGTYKPTAGVDRSATFALTSGVKVLGGYAGYGAADPNARDVSAYVTVLSGDIGTVGVTFDNTYHVVTTSGTDATTVLEGFTITAGNASGSSANGGGGGVYNYSGNATISDCRFADNWAKYGGAMNNSQSSCSLVTHCTFIDNHAYWGGAMFNDDHGDPCVAACRFLSNSATFDGGAIYNGWMSHPTLLNCQLSGNTAQNGGGVYSFEHSFSVLINCTFTENLATDRGGGIYNTIDVGFGGPILANCIFRQNRDNYGVNELSQLFTSSAPGRIVPFVDYTCLQGWTGLLGGVGNIDVDPCFVDADGPDNTFGTEDDNLRLLAWSRCIEAGGNGSAPAGVDRDLDDRDRFRDGDCTAPTIVDMGAYEFTYADQGDVNGDCFVDLGDFEPLAAAWESQPGKANWNSNCNIASPSDNTIDLADLLVIIKHWLTSTQ